jgi:4-hydroxy-tetrahydrodipicolinate reductase
MTINVGICGASGRMGLALIQKITTLSDLRIISPLKAKDRNNVGLDILCQNSDIVIDFSSPELLEKLLQEAKTYGTKLVIGTTGFDSKHFVMLKEASSIIPILYAPNMSVGANLIAMLLKQAAQILNNNYAITITDRHHHLKKDAPSGTALMFGKIIAQARNLEFESEAIYDSDIKTILETLCHIQFTSIREGEAHGQHNIAFSNNDEIISLNHQALNNNPYVDGAILASHFIINKQLGLYSMSDIFASMTIFK